MLKTYFIDTCIKVFKRLQLTYSFRLQVFSNELTYHNSSTSFSVYFDREFDIFICFHMNGINLYLYDLMRFLDFGEDAFVLLKRNQVSSTAGIDYVLNNLQSIMEKVLFAIQEDPSLLSQCLERQQNNKTRQIRFEQSKFLSHELDTAWKEKRYSELVSLFESNENLTEYLANLDLVTKRVHYARGVLQKMQNPDENGSSTGDGSVC